MTTAWISPTELLRAPRRWLNLTRPIVVVLLPFWAMACGSSERPPSASAKPPLPEEIPATTAVPAARFTRGFALGKLRQDIKIAPFSISTTPTTVGRYKECIAAGACTPPELTAGACATAQPFLPEGKTFDTRPEHDELPVTCTTPEQAKAYCGWVGGALPTVDQWLYAARGPSVQRYSWGDLPPDCKSHPRATPIEQDGIGCCPGGTCSPEKFFAVAQRPEASSPFGVLDVLLTPAELLQGSKESSIPSCKQDTCAVQGILPGAIDFASWLPDAKLSNPGPAYGFRCVFEVTQ